MSISAPTSTSMYRSSVRTTVLVARVGKAAAAAAGPAEAAAKTVALPVFSVFSHPPTGAKFCGGGAKYSEGENIIWMASFGPTRRELVRVAGEGRGRRPTASRTKKYNFLQMASFKRELYGKYDEGINECFFCQHSKYVSFCNKSIFLP